MSWARKTSTISLLIHGLDIIPADLTIARWVRLLVLSVLVSFAEMTASAWGAPTTRHRLVSNHHSRAWTGPSTATAFRLHQQWRKHVWAAGEWWDQTVGLKASLPCRIRPHDARDPAMSGDAPRKSLLLSTTWRETQPYSFERIPFVREARRCSKQPHSRYSVAEVNGSRYICMLQISYNRLVRWQTVILSRP